MRVLILYKNKIKPGSYAHFLQNTLLHLLNTQQYAMAEANSLAESGKLLAGSEQAVIQVYLSGAFTLLQKIQLPFFLKRQAISLIVQFTASGMLHSAHVPQLLINTAGGWHTQPLQLNSNEILVLCSEANKQSLLPTSLLPQSSVAVVPAAARGDYKPLPWVDKQSLKMKYMQGREYFMTSADGKTLPQFMLLLKAFSGFKKWQHSSMKLVAGGVLGFADNEEWKEKIRTYKYRDDVVLLPGVSEEEYIQLLGGAYAYVHTPLQENDVLPLLQCLQTETPCIAFSTGSIEEYAAGAALLIEAENYEALSEKMLLLYRDEALRSRLIQQGTERAARYQPQVAEQHLQALLQSMNSR